MMREFLVLGAYLQRTFFIISVVTSNGLVLSEVRLLISGKVYPTTQPKL